MSEERVYEGLLEVTKYEVAGELPNPFIFDDGSEVKTPADWVRRRAEIYKSTIELQYGVPAPSPEFLEVEPLYIVDAPGKASTYKIKTGRRECPVTFTMYVFKSKKREGVDLPPAVISGDLCFPYCFNKEYLGVFVEAGIDFVTFNRTELAPDIAEYNLLSLEKDSEQYRLATKSLDVIKARCCGGALKECYPDYSFGAIAAWAWGYSRCVDALELLGIADMSMIAFTGHSRGGKTAALAGVLDERCAVVNPNATCQGANGSYRIYMEAFLGERILKSETLKHLLHHFPAWLGEDMHTYIGREAELPFDAHYLKALVAPRVLFVSEAANDILANPIGTWQTSMAASEVYSFLGCPERLLWYFRRGTHYHDIEDIEQLVNVICHFKWGEPLNDKYFVTPFKRPALAYSWRAPKEN